MVNKIIDCFTFYNELKMLKFRLEYLYKHVDFFVLVEATLTHSGNPKELYYENNKHLFEKYNDKIIHVIVKDLSPLEKTNDSWVRENEQRNAIDRGIKIIENRYGLDDTDIIFLSDLDEIPDRNIMTLIRPTGMNNNTRYQLLQDHYWYNLNCLFGNKWDLARIVNYHTYKNIFNRVLQDIRVKFLPTINTYHIQRGGWHFSWYGDADFIINKIKNFAHQEFNNEKYLNKEILNNYIKNNISFVEPNKLHGGTKYISFEENNYLPHNYEMLL